MRKWLLYVGLFVACVVLGYLLRGAIGREVYIWIAVGSLALVVVLKLVQLGLMRFVKIAEARMSPEERREFEEFKKQHSSGEKAK